VIGIRDHLHRHLRIPIELIAELLVHVEIIFKRSDKVVFDSVRDANAKLVI